MKERNGSLEARRTIARQIFGRIVTHPSGWTSCAMCRPVAIVRRNELVQRRARGLPARIVLFAKDHSWTRQRCVRGSESKLNCEQGSHEMER